MASLQQKERANVEAEETELRSEYSRSQDGVEIVREGDAAVCDLARDDA
jgi:hypothetical protein